MNRNSDDRKGAMLVCLFTRRIRATKTTQKNENIWKTKESSAENWISAVTVFIQWNRSRSHELVAKKERIHYHANPNKRFESDERWVIVLNWTTSRNKNKTKMIRCLFRHKTCVDYDSPIYKTNKIDGCEAHSSEFMRSLREHPYTTQTLNLSKAIKRKRNKIYSFPTVFSAPFLMVSSQWVARLASECDFDKWMVWCQQSAYEMPNDDDSHSNVLLNEKSYKYK